LELGGNSQAFDPQPLAAYGDLLGLQQRRRGGNRPLGRLEGNLPFRGERVEVELWLDETDRGGAWFALSEAVAIAIPSSPCSKTHGREAESHPARR